jgi:hypothetical protein|tara:strand:- start:780 stop:950 length:171 start_codon:yes stop_codon:yes gene_type:complete
MSAMEYHKFPPGSAIEHTSAMHSNPTATQNVMYAAVPFSGAMFPSNVMTSPASATT